MTDFAGLLRRLTEAQVNFILIDVLGEIAGGGSYPNLLPHTFEVQLFGHKCRCLELNELIRVKRAAGRPKDFEVIAELEAILEERGE